jgi:PAS domain-containing protein
MHPWRTADGAIGGILIFTEDITQERKDKEQLQLAASVFTNAREGILICDPQGAILDANEMFTRITGYSREEDGGAILGCGNRGGKARDFTATCGGRWRRAAGGRARYGTRPKMAEYFRSC